MKSKRIEESIRKLLEIQNEVGKNLQGVHKEIFNTVKNAGKEDTKEVPS